MGRDTEGLGESVGRRTGPERKRGRPPGKRSNPEYVQLTAYVREENLDEAKAALLKRLVGVLRSPSQQVSEG
jgi:hypothetical protein